MAGLMILISVLAAGAFAKRVATKQDIVQVQKEAVANGPGILPVQPALPPRAAVMPRTGVPGMVMQGGGNAGRYPADLRTPWKGLDTSTNVRMSADDDQVGEFVRPLTPQDFQAAAFEAAMDKKMENVRVNIRRAFESLQTDIPQILQLETEGKTPMDWDIYADDFKTTFPEFCNTDDGCSIDDSAMLVMFIAVAAKHVPSWAKIIEGKDLHKAGLDELRTFINKKVTKAEVTGQDDCMDKDGDWCVLTGILTGDDVSGLDPELSTHEGEEVIKSFWKTELTMDTALTTHPEAIVTIQGLSMFHLNEDGKIYRHSITQLNIRLNQEIKFEEAQLFLERLANAPRDVK